MDYGVIITLPETQPENQTITDNDHNLDEYFGTFESCNLDQVIQKAEQIRQAKPNYNPINNNCQHFARAMYENIINDC